jgi:hypothetical protein
MSSVKSLSMADDLLHAGKCLYASHHTAECISLLNHLLAVDPLNRDAHIQLAYAYSRLGDYIKGRDELVWVWMPVFGNQTGLLHPTKDLTGLKILISSDAGLGDCIMFCRFLKLLKNRKCHVTLQVPDPLVRLMQQSNLADTVISPHVQLPQHDIRVPMHNLMAALVTDPQDPHISRSNYLCANQSEIDYFSYLIPKNSSRKVGLCWSGNPSLPDDNLRSVSLEFIQSLTQDNDELFSLIPGSSMDDGRRMHWFQFKDIAETAALIKNLDFVITVDTMIGHLCGALGIPTLLLNRFNGCWRWSEEGQKNAWYDSVEIKRQSMSLNW